MAKESEDKMQESLDVLSLSQKTVDKVCRGSGRGSNTHARERKEAANPLSPETLRGLKTLLGTPAR